MGCWLGKKRKANDVLFYCKREMLRFFENVTGNYRVEFMFFVKKKQIVFCNKLKGVRSSADPVNLFSSHLIDTSSIKLVVKKQMFPNPITAAGVHPCPKTLQKPSMSPKKKSSLSLMHTNRLPSECSQPSKLASFLCMCPAKFRRYLGTYQKFI